MGEKKMTKQYRRYNFLAIKNLRARHNLSTREFAQKIQSHANVVLEWESGRIKPSITTIEKIMAAFEVTEDIFFHNENARMPD